MKSDIKLAPIIVFAYNRPDHYKKTLEALSNNILANQSVLYLYCDGAKLNATEDTLNRISEVRQIAKEQHWAKETYVIESEQNKGLADSIIGGVTEIVNKYGRVIVLEDDMITSPGFLQYMNDALELYKDEEKVMHITGYMYPHRWPLPETFFYDVPLCWGWGTWSRAWKFFNKDATFHYNFWKSDWKTFDKVGSDVLSSQLIANFKGVLKTWFIMWHASVLEQNGLTLVPGRSLINNIGFDDTGTNCCVTNKYDNRTLPNTIKVKKIKIKKHALASSEIYSVYQGRWYNKRRRNAAFDSILNFIRHLLISNTVND